MAKLDKYRLGLDVGTNSLGWSVLKLDEKGEPCAIKDAGVRIFADGRDEKSKATLAATRREKRSARRRRDRFLQRQKDLLNALTKAGLFPDEKGGGRKALQKLNPLELRALLLSESAADILEKIKKRKDKAGKAASAADLKPEYLIGRALFHINQRRGFKSSRKDRSEETVSGKVSNSARKLLEDMQLIAPPMLVEEYKALSKEDKKQQRQKEAEDRIEALGKLKEQKELSFGKFLYERQKNKKQTRARSSADGKLYDVYPTREIYEDEFDKIWAAQTKHFSNVMGDEVRETIRDEIIFHQRKLKPQERGLCAYMNKEKRAFRAMPSFQHYRIYQEVNNLEWRTSDGPHCLRDNRAARDPIIDLMEKPTNKRGNITFGTMKKTLKNMKLAEGTFQFNFETPKRTGFDGNLTSNVMQHEDYIGPDWHKWALDKQDAFIDIILDDELDDEEVKAHLIKTYGLSETVADNCMNASLQDGVANISLKAAQLMLAKMRDGVEDENGETYLPLQSEAAEIVAEEVAEFVNPMRRPKTEEDKFEPEASLPYYGEWFQNGSHIIPGKRKPEDKHDDRKYFGGITNPTVHIALNQIRQTVNELIRRHKLFSDENPTSIAIELGRNLPEGADGRREIEREQKENQDRNEKLDKELNERGQETNRENRLRLRLWEECEGFCPYSGDKIGKAELFNVTTQIDHIIPWSKSLDDSYANKVICTQQANQDKKQRTPYEAFHNHPNYNWDDLFERVKILPKSKQWRFQENALKLWDGDNEEIEKAAQKMTEHKDANVQKIGKQILELGVSSLNDEQKKIAAEHGIVDADFSQRHLNDTRYIGRLTREYLESICHIDKIDVITGRLTALLRGHWGLNSILRELENDDKPPKDHNLPEEVQEEKSQKKNRDDHRHHAIDAIVIAMTNKSTLQKVATAANKAEELKIERLFPKDKKGHSAIDPDWIDTSGEKVNFRGAVKEAVKNIIVSHKARRKKLRKGTTDGQLHNETALGLVECLNKEKNEYRTVVRRPIDYFKDLKHVKAIRDDKLRAEFLQAFGENGIKGIEKLAKDKHIRRLRCFGPKQAIPIKDKNGNAYKGYQGDSNWGMEIYAGHKKDIEEWEGVVISRFEANHPKFKPGTTYRPHPAARLVMRLQINDCIEIEDKGKKQYMRLQLMSQSGQLVFAPLHEANVDGRSRKGEFKYLRKNANPLRELKARKIHISPTGQVSYEKRRKPRRKPRRK